jgi:hypothetical protein
VVYMCLCGPFGMGFASYEVNGAKGGAHRTYLVLT